jgi:uncharacterized membrane protein
MEHRDTWHRAHQQRRPLSARFADAVASGMGSWTFIITQTLILAVWIGANFAAFAYKWDPYPFILLNLLFSAQAAYTAPIIMMSQNRQSERDRHQAEADYETNRRAKEEIEDLQRGLARIETEKLDRILSLLEK